MHDMVLRGCEPGPANPHRNPEPVLISVERMLEALACHAVSPACQSFQTPFPCRYGDPVSCRFEREEAGYHDFTLVAAMSVVVEIPSQLFAECGGRSAIHVSATSVRSALDQIEVSYPRLYRSVCDETGAVRRHVNLFVNNSLIRVRDGLDVALSPGDVVAIMPAVSGG